MLLRNQEPSPEYNWYMDSTRREADGPDPTNPTNVITVKHSFAQSRLPVSQISLLSAEIPLVQQTIEEGVNDRLYFMEGLRLITESSPETDIRTLRMHIDGVLYLVRVPLSSNPIIQVDAVTHLPDILMTFLYPHALEGQLGLVPGPRLVSTDINLLPAYTLNASNTTIFSPTQLLISGITTATWGGAATHGYLQGPPLSNPNDLASQLTNAFAVMTASNALAERYRVVYNVSTGQFVITQTGSGLPTYIEILSAESLGYIMGFGVGVKPLVKSYQPLDRASAASCEVIQAVASYGFQCWSYVEIPAGNYPCGGFLQAIQFQLNRLYFDGGNAGSPVTNPTMIFTAQGILRTVIIAFGKYTPSRMADELETAMNNAVGGLEYSVEYTSDHQFCIRSVTGTPFTLEFADALDTIHMRLGFESLTYSGASEYCGNPVNIPTVQCCQLDAYNCGDPNRYPALVYELFTNAPDYACIKASSPRLIVASIERPGAGDAIITTTTTAHGVQCGDFVHIITGPNQYILRVTSVTNSQVFTVDPCDVIPNPLAPTAITFQVDQFASPSLYFGGPASVPARYLGFGDLLSGFANDSNQLCSPFLMDLSHPAYILLVADTPVGATHNNHTNGTSNIFNVLAKLILYPNYKLERLLPFTMFLPQVVDVTAMKFRILNPDHSPLQLHGKNWSCTISFLVCNDTSSQLLAR